MSDIGAIAAEGVVPCANCHAPLAGPYCAACGQPRDIHRRSLGGLLHDFIQDVVAFDSRIIRTARALLLQPGELALAYRQGRTQPYVPPVRLYIFVSLLFFLTLSLTNIAIMQFRLDATPIAVQLDDQNHPYRISDGEKEALPQSYADGKPHYDFNPSMVFFTRQGPEHSGLNPQARAVAEATLHSPKISKTRQSQAFVTRLSNIVERFATDPGAFNRAVTDWIPRMLFLLLPLFALLLALLYWRQRKTFYFVDHLVFSLNFHSFGFALLLAGALADQFLRSGVVPGLVVAALALYLLLAMHRVYGQGWKITAAKFAALGAVYFLFLLLPTFIGIILLAVFGVDAPHAA